MTLGFSRNLGISNINEHYINTVVYEPTKGSSYIPLPVGLRNSTKGLVNLRNNENECFRRCHMRYLNLQEKDPQRIKKSDKRMVEDLRVSLPKTGPLRFGSENQFPLNFAHEYILVQK